MSVQIGPPAGLGVDLTTCSDLASKTRTHRLESEIGLTSQSSSRMLGSLRVPRVQFSASLTMFSPGK